MIGFAVLQGYIVLDGCAAVLARLRLHQSALGAWLDTMVGDFVSIVLILAVGRALWAHGGTFLDMKMAAGRRGDDAVLRGRDVPRAGAPGRGRRLEAALVVRLRAVTALRQRRRQPIDQGRGMLGRRDLLIAAGLGLAAFDQLPVVLLLLLIVAISRAGAALIQLFTPDWRIRPPV